MFASGQFTHTPSNPAFAEVVTNVPRPHQMGLPDTASWLVSCPAPQILLAYLEGALDSRTAAKIAGHLIVCRTCSDLEDRLESFDRTSSSPLESDRYQLLEELGRGGMGIVYRAHDRRKNRVIAIKLMRPEIQSEEHSLRRLEAEVLLARAVRHPNVCRTYGFHRTSLSAY